MSKEICLLPSLPYDYSQAVCRASEAAPWLAPLPTSPAEFTSPPTSAETNTAPSALWRDSQAFRRALLRDAFGSASPAHGAARFESPLAYSLWALLPAACSSHPPLSDDSAGGGGSDANSNDGGVSIPPQLTSFETHDSSPCGAQGMITDLDEGLGVCANYTTGNHHLFSWNPAAPGSAQSIVPLSFPPDQVLQGSGNEIYITTHQNPGISVVNPVVGNESHYTFPTSLPTTLPTSSGRSLSSLHPSFPKGLVEIDGRVFVATSNYDEVHEDFQPGTVLAFAPGSGDFTALETSGYNPTSVAAANGLLLVVSSGAIDRHGQVTSEGFLDVFDPVSYERRRSVSLGNRGAGLSGEMTLTPDGNTLVLPTADNSGQLLVVDLRTSQVREISLRAAGLSGSRMFFPSVQLSEDGRYAVVANFNDGKLYSVDLHTGALTGSGLALDSNTGDGEGLSDGLRVGRDFFLGLGPRVLRLSSGN